MATKVPPVAPASDPFGDAFASFAKDDTIDPNAANPNIKPVVEEPPAVVVGTETVVDPAAATVATPAVTEPAVLTDGDGLPTPDEVAAAAAAKLEEDKKKVAPVVEATPAPPYEDVINKFTAAVEKMHPQPTAAQPVEETPPFTAEEQQILTDFAKDLPEAAAAMQLMTRETARQTAMYIFSQLGPVISALQQQTTKITNESHIDQIYSLVPDYDEVREKAIAWAQDAKQPAFMRKAYDNVIKDGSPQDIATLVDQYRVANNIAKPATATAAAPAVAKPAVKTPVVDPAVAAAAAALAPVKTQRSQVNGEGLIDPNNFDEAFSKFAGMDA